MFDVDNSSRYIEKKEYFIELLVKKAKTGDKQAEKQIFDYLFVRFKYLAKRNIGIEDCEDLAQEACITVLEKYKDEEFTISFTAWAYGVLRMKIGNYLQSKQRISGKRSSLNEEVKLSQDSTTEPRLIQLLIECIKEISKAYLRYARTLNLNYQGYSTEEICKRLDITTSNYYVILNRGRAMLKKCLGKGGIL